MNENSVWPRPKVVPLPCTVNNVKQPCLRLSGCNWKWNPAPPPGYASPGYDFSAWEDIYVPSHLPGSRDSEYAYVRTIHIPEDWEGCRILLRFDGANCYARIFIDGQFSGEHYGGFVSWDCDITAYVVPGRVHVLTVGMEDKPNEVNVFHSGGLIRDVTMVALPQAHLTRLHVQTTFDSSYVDAELTVLSELSCTADLELSMSDPEGRVTPLSFSACDNEVLKRYAISRPIKWDSEHPCLYTLNAAVWDNGICVETVNIPFGFRQIEIRERKMLINGDEVKLRGVNRHDIHPVTGRAISGELVEKDIKLFKEANINFIRTSHYPPRPDFLALCDQYGIYVEDEIAVAFLGQQIQYTENDPQYTHCFMNQFTEMLERDLSHPCVIIWSLANESYWGSNFRLMNEYAHAADPTRPTIFSYPITMQEDDGLTDIWSMHYAAWGQDPSALVDSFDRSLHWPVDIPVLHDESTHIPCYCRKDLRRDPGVRDFYGETISRFWDILWRTPGAIGCAIWAGLDDVWYNSGRAYPGPSWGIMDGWRRKKPEYWHVRKAFSPIKLQEKQVSLNADGTIFIPVENRFNHTNLNEITIHWRTDSGRGILSGPDLLPHGHGGIAIPGNFSRKDQIRIEFQDHSGFLVEEYDINLNESIPLLPALDGGRPQIHQEAGQIRVWGDRFSLAFSCETGLITEGAVAGERVLIDGPALHLVGLALGPWELKSINARQLDHCAEITISGHYDRIYVTFVIRIDAQGHMATTYTLDSMPYSSPRKLAMRIGDDTDTGGYEEVGVSFTLPPEMDTLSWNRIGLWSVYPEWHIGRLQGTAKAHNGLPSVSFLKQPECEWYHEECDAATFGLFDVGHRGTEDFRSSKFSILKAHLSAGGAGPAFSALSDGTDSVRMELCPQPCCIVDDRDSRICYAGSWIRRDTQFRSLNGTETWSRIAGDTAKITFHGTGICWISSLDIICGTARVSVDGRLAEEPVSLGILLGPGVPRGYEKDYRRTVFAIDDLEPGEHTLCIEVTGEKAKGSSNCYVNIDHFIILNPLYKENVNFIVNSEVNFPELSWGDYSKPPILVETGYTRTIYTHLSVIRHPSI
jgi:hypothetical protein